MMILNKKNLQTRRPRTAKQVSGRMRLSSERQTCSQKGGKSTIGGSISIIGKPNKPSGSRNTTGHHKVLCRLATVLFLLECANVQSTSISPGFWTDITVPGAGLLPSSRTDHTMLAWNGSLFLFGGNALEDGLTKPSKELHEYKIDQSAWIQLSTPVTSAPSPRYQHAMAAWEGALYIFGGYNYGDGEAEIFNDVYRYDIRSGTWRDVSEASAPPRFQHAMAGWGGKLYAFGGFVFSQGANRLSNILQEYDIATRTWTDRSGGAVPFQRRGHVMTAWDGSLYVFGGWGEESVGLNDLHRFDIFSATWSDIGSDANGFPPAERSEHAMIAFKEALYVFGGSGKTERFNDLHAYLIASRTWVELSAGNIAPAVRSEHAMAIWNEALFVFSGAAAGGSAPRLRDFFRLDLCVPGCNAEAGCLNSTCVCDAGFAGNGVDECSNVDECADSSTRLCHEQATCVDSEGSFFCLCNTGYNGTMRDEDGKLVCANINECDNGGHNCHRNSRCTDHEGHFSCACKEGYAGDGE
eukprot:3895996-Rhodomonas_salina.1